MVKLKINKQNRMKKTKNPLNVESRIRLIDGKNNGKNISTNFEKTENVCKHKIVTKPVMEIL